TTNLVKMLAGSSVSGASAASFVDGPVKKTGNTSFVFPIGNLESYRPLQISSPGNSTDAFMSQYFDLGQLQGDSLDTVLTQISYCNNWKLDRKNGSSNVYVTLSWDTSHCAVFDTTYMRLAYWNGADWIDKGHGTFTGTLNTGNMTSAATISSFGYFTLATNQNMSAPCGGATFQLYNKSASYVMSTYTSGNSTWIPVVGQSIYITGTFTIDHNFTFD